MPRLTLPLAAAILLTLLAFSAEVAIGQRGEIIVERSWARATPPGATTAAGYLTLTSRSGDRLISISSPEAARVEVHETAFADGVMTMRQVKDGLPLPAGEAVVLEPGGRHLMFTQLAGPLADGDEVPVTLTFERAGDLEALLDVVPLGAGGPPGMERSGASHGGGTTAPSRKR